MDKLVKVVEEMPGNGTASETLNDEIVDDDGYSLNLLYSLAARMTMLDGEVDRVQQKAVFLQELMLRLLEVEFKEMKSSEVAELLRWVNYDSNENFSSLHAVHDAIADKKSNKVFFSVAKYFLYREMEHEK